MVHRSDAVADMMSFIGEYERLAAANPPPHASSTAIAHARTLREQCEVACQRGLEAIGPLKAVSLCIAMLQDYLPMVVYIDPKNNEYARIIRKARRWLGSPQGLSKSLPYVDLPNYDMGTSYSWALIEFMFCIEDIEQRGGTPFEEERLDGGGPRRGWSWHCVRGQVECGCIDGCIASWEKDAWDRTLATTPEADRTFMWLYPLVAATWVTKWRMVVDLLRSRVGELGTSSRAISHGSIKP